MHVFRIAAMHMEISTQAPVKDKEIRTVLQTARLVDPVLWFCCFFGRIGKRQYDNRVLLVKAVFVCFG